MILMQRRWIQQLWCSFIVSLSVKDIVIKSILSAKTTLQKEYKQVGIYNTVQKTRKARKVCLKGIFYRLKVFIGPKLREVSIGNFHRKAPKCAKNRVKGSKIYQIRTKLHPTYCGNPPIPSSELLWESNYQQVESHSSSDDRIGGFPQ